MSKVIFVEEISKILEERVKEKGSTGLSEPAEEYFNLLKEGKIASPITKMGREILLAMNEKISDERPNLSAREIGEILGISGRSISGSMQKLIVNRYCEKVSENPVRYRLTPDGYLFVEKL